MLITPAIIALHLITAGVTGTVVLAGGFAVQILRSWDIHSGSELQIRLERQTYLISTLLGFALCAELLSLVLFVHTAENLSSQFVGAMCATGVLNVNAFGFPSLLLKIAVFFLAALWLLLNGVDQRGYDYPLVRLKYWLLLAIAPLTVAEAMAQTVYFLRLEPEVITSCCGSLFGGQQGVAAELASLPAKPTIILFYTMGGAMLVLGWAFRRGLALGLLFAAGNVLLFGVALAAIIGFLSLYVYENPHHHCPFCLLKAGYDYLGYALYLALFAAVASGLGAGLLAPFRHIPSLQAVIPVTIQRLTWTTLSGLGLFYALATWLILRSNLVLLG
ncbi:conserved membrane hypothetical protein [Candidatus Competibacter denitrificans Run_A_D11]|uniref:Vitamin K epoxide reductase domain-containing protein n=1 Tax=Candidatus Competibacter denitrificans Run_A_D11 TaxID=1400863 RepID=W6MCD4_9GAMM|nr:hypothetical protein [Candidatus Competibacter denitrificans]CDI01908.1 conserved membrane hypothetical protein [Candidatus Competibacter denitrificans Run_A_D11]HRC68131.1 hypothetical protein [Candidatus Competibacter denitrificans]